MKRLFNEYEAYTNEGSDLYRLFCEKVAALFDEYSRYSTIDAEKIMYDAVSTEAAIERIRRSVLLKKKERGRY